MLFVPFCNYSGQQIVGPPRKKKEKSGNEMTQSIFDAAKRSVESLLSIDQLVHPFHHLPISLSAFLFVCLSVLEKAPTVCRKFQTFRHGAEVVDESEDQRSETKKRSAFRGSGSDLKYRNTIFVI